MKGLGKWTDLEHEQWSSIGIKAGVETFWIYIDWLRSVWTCEQLEFDNQSIPEDALTDRESVKRIVLKVCHDRSQELTNALKQAIEDNNKGE